MRTPNFFVFLPFSVFLSPTVLILFSSELQNGSFTSGSRATKARENAEKRKGGGFV
jgi:hypothetical protein